MYPRFRWSDVSTVGHYLGTLLLVVGALMAIPTLIALLFGEMACAADFLFSAGLCVLAGAILRFLPTYGISRRRMLLTTGVSWVVVAFFAAIPLFLTGGFISFVDALHDAVAALTTTGASLATDLDHLSYSQITWRAVLSLLGGQGVVIISLYLGFFNTGGEERRVRVASSAETIREQVKDIGHLIWIATGALVIIGTIIAAVIGLASGLTPADSFMNGFWLTSVAYNTGGFVPHTSSLVFYHSLPFDTFAAVFILLGCLNFGLYALILRGDIRKIFRNSELRAFLLWLVILVVVVTVVLTREDIYNTFTGFFTHGTFMVISAVGTSGMQTVYPEQFGYTLADGALIMLMIAALAGGCSSSTAGGIKIGRIMEVVRWFWYSILRALSPKNAVITVKYNHFGVRRMDAEDAKHAMTIFLLYAIFAILGAMAFIAHGNDALDSLFESVGYVSNTGISTGIITPSMSLDLKVIVMLQMWAGRMEFVALLAIVFGLFLTFKPHIPNIPDGVVSTRARQRRQVRREKFTRLRKRIFSGRKDDDAHVHIFSAVLAAVLALSLAAAPLALAAESEVSDLSGAYRRFDIEELLSATTRMDGQEVSIEGEAIGFSITADATHKWVNIMQGGKSIGVYMTNEQAEQIEFYGKYRTTGDIVSVHGTLNVACVDHNNDLEVHADSVLIKKEGSQKAKNPSEKKAILGFLMIFVGGLLTAALYFAKRRWPGFGKRIE